jgi:hypothetical protein
LEYSKNRKLYLFERLDKYFYFKPLNNLIDTECGGDVFFISLHHGDSNLSIFTPIEIDRLKDNEEFSRQHKVNNFLPVVKLNANAHFINSKRKFYRSWLFFSNVSDYNYPNYYKCLEIADEGKNNPFNRFVYKIVNPLEILKESKRDKIVVIRDNDFEPKFYLSEYFDTWRINRESLFPRPLKSFTKKEYREMSDEYREFINAKEKVVELNRKMQEFSRKKFMDNAQLEWTRKNISSNKPYPLKISLF